MADLFDAPALRIRQLGKLLADRANYQIFGADRTLLATAAETGGLPRRAQQPLTASQGRGRQRGAPRHVAAR